MNKQTHKNGQILQVIEKEAKDVKFNFNEQPLGGVCYTNLPQRNQC